MLKPVVEFEVGVANVEFSDATMLMTVVEFKDGSDAALLVGAREEGVPREPLESPEKTPSSAMKKTAPRIANAHIKTNRRGMA